ncbi:DUF6531 domain-containing protein [uncultured Microbulbifer sp.]|uniref:DUF6531 domain-containing protein n=1 Tax=uncultured Microbulbifer sp. TaxID=348147 RepID=UPI0025F0194A|nr:DUF6531 domain-containing protein [uncultured Microbulbifer sp.]
MTPERLVDFIPKRISELEPPDLPPASVSAPELCRWLDASSVTGATVPPNFQHSPWPQPPTILATGFSLSRAPDQPWMHTPTQFPVRFCNYAGTSLHGNTLPDLSRCRRVAEHVIAASGETAFSRTDLVLGGPFEFRWQRYYRPSANGDSCLGSGWRHTLNEKLQLAGTDEASKDKITLHTAEGRLVIFDLPEIGHGCFNRSERLLLVRQSLFSFRLSGFSHPDKIFRADGAGSYAPLCELRDGFGNTLAIDYRDNCPHRIVTSWGRTLEFHYRDGYLSEIRDLNQSPESNARCSYLYGEGNRLHAAHTGAMRENYFYENHHLSRLEGNAHGTVSFEYDDLQRCNLVAQNGLVHRLRWQQRRHTCLLSSEARHDIEIRFDTFGDVILERQHDRETRYFYDYYRNLTLKVTADGQREIFRYDKFGRLLRRTCKELHHRYQYDATGRLLAVHLAGDQNWHFAYGEHFQPLSIVDPAGNQWKFGYDDRGQLRQLTDPELGTVALDWDAQSLLRSLRRGDSTWQWRYDHSGRVAHQSGPYSAERQWHYDDAGELSGCVIAGATLELFRDTEQYPCRISMDGECQLQWQRDEFGRIRHISFASGDSWEMNYDAWGSLVQLECVGEDGEEHVLQWQYDPFGQVIRFYDSRNHWREWQHDAGGRITEYRDRDSHWYFLYSETGPLHEIRNNNGQRCNFHFDTMGRLLQAANSHSNLRFQYDQCGNLAAEHHDITGGESLSLSYRYDKRGWLNSASSESFRAGFIFAASGGLYEISANGKMTLRTESKEASEIWSQGNCQIRRAYKDGFLSEISLDGDRNWRINTPKVFPRQLKDILQRPSTAHSVEQAVAQNQRGNVIVTARPSYRADGKSQFQYDGWGLMQSAECGDFKSYFRYDAFGRRYGKISSHRGSGRQRQLIHHWWSFGLWSECSLQEGEKLLSHYLHHPHLNIAISCWREGSQQHYIADDTGRLLALLDNEGSPLWKIDSAEGSPGVYRGTAGLFDSETRLFYRDFSYWHAGAETRCATVLLSGGEWLRQLSQGHKPQ